VQTRGRAAAGDLGTMGVALGACTVPAVGRPGFDLGATEIELGLGIHGEQGVERTALLPADAVVERLLGSILADLELPHGSSVALLVNGLGGTTAMELAIVARHALAVLRGRGLQVERAWMGEFLTALEMPGCSLSILKVDRARLVLLDAPAESSAWRAGSDLAAMRKIVPATIPPVLPEQPPGPYARRLRSAALAVAAALEAAEPLLTDLDSRAGDGDLGLSMTRGAAAIRALGEGAWADPPTALSRIGDALRRAIGGSSGPFYAAALLRASRTLPAMPTPADWAKCFRAGVDAIADLGGAKLGDCTMLDALLPAVDAFEASLARAEGAAAALRAATDAAEAGAATTAAMIGRLGRASYLGHRVIGIQDGGATAVAIWLRALTRAFG
jgi:dihydroxyacetone kinase